MMQKWMQLELLFILTLMMGVPSVMADKQASQAEISNLSGEVQWLKAGTEKWQAARTNLKVNAGDKIRTEQDGNAALRLADGSTVQIQPGTELTVQSLLWDKNGGHREFIFGFSKGKVSAQVMPISEGSIFRIETPLTNVTVPVAQVDPAPSITINPDGSLTATSTEGPIDLTGEGDILYTAHLGPDEIALLQYTAATGELRITSVAGTFEVIGPDGVTYVLNPGDSVILKKGAATFLPLTPPLGDPPFGASAFEPSTADPDGGAAAALSSAASGG